MELLQQRKKRGPKPFRRLRALGCFDEVRNQLAAGWPAPDLALDLQQRGHCREIKPASLERSLRNLRASIPPSELVRARIPRAHIEAIEKVGEQVDALMELTRLYHQQIERIEIDMALERRISKLLPTTHREFRVVIEIINRIHQLQMDLGLHDGTTPAVDMEARAQDAIDERYAGTEVGKVLSDPKKRRRLLNICEHALSLADRGIAIRKTEDGELELVQANDGQDVEPASTSRSSSSTA